MKGGNFLDTNIIVYSLGNNQKKKEITNSLIDSNPIISTQVINELVNVCLKKLKLTKEESFKVGRFLLTKCSIKTLNISTIDSAMNISIKYNFSYWDSLIISSALENGCSIVYSEDLQHNQVIENKLKILNPYI